MGSILLQESEATVVVFDLRDFSTLAANLAPLDLGMQLGRFYEHAEKIILENGGRLVKFMSDAVMGAWIDTEVDGHRTRGLAAVQQAVSSRKEFGERGTKMNMPLLDYSVAAASGKVLCGQIGTRRTTTFDVLGEPASLAQRLCVVATYRGVDHLVTGDVLDVPDRPKVIEVEGFEIGGSPQRLFRLE